MRLSWLQNKQVILFSSRDIVTVVARMDMPDVSLFLKLGYGLFVWSGVPISSAEATRASSCLRLATSLFCLISRLSISIVCTYWIIKTDIFSEEGNKGEIVYYGRIWVLYYCEVLLTYFILFRNRRELRTIFDTMKILEEAATRNRTGQDYVVLMWKTVLVLLTIVGATISALDNTSNILHVMHADENQTAFILVILYSYPLYLFTWVVCYNAAVVWMTELQFNRKDLRRISTDRYLNKLKPVLASVNVNHCSIYFLHDPKHSRSSKSYIKPRDYCSGNNKRLTRFTALKMFGEFTNRKLSTALTVMLTANAFFLPLVFSAYYQKEFNFVTSNFYGSSAYYNFFWISSVFLLPVLLKEWNKGVSKTLVLIAKKDIYTVSDLETKRMLSKFVSSAGDEYPNSWWKFFCYDFEMISDIFDVTILLSTTFILP